MTNELNELLTTVKSLGTAEDLKKKLEYLKEFDGALIVKGTVHRTEINLLSEPLSMAVLIFLTDELNKIVTKKEGEIKEQIKNLKG